MASKDCARLPTKYALTSRESLSGTLVSRARKLALKKPRYHAGHRDTYYKAKKSLVSKTGCDKAVAVGLVVLKGTADPQRPKANRKLAANVRAWVELANSD